MTRGVPSVIEGFLEAIESRDLRRVALLLSPDVSWQNVPAPPVVGRRDVIAMFDRIVPLCERIEWEIVSASYEQDLVWVERVDRFWIDGECHCAPCNGVFMIDPQRQQLLAVRDYVDLQRWRRQIDPVYERRRNESPAEVVERHLRAVRRLDTVAMAADYSVDATLTRPGAMFVGRSSIADYFDTVEDRIAGRVVRFDEPITETAERVTVRWSIPSGGGIITGVDDYVVTNGRIVEQIVRLDGGDF